MQQCRAVSAVTRKTSTRLPGVRLTVTQSSSSHKTHRHTAHHNTPEHITTLNTTLNVTQLFRLTSPYITFNIKRFELDSYCNVTVADY